MCTKRREPRPKDVRDRVLYDLYVLELRVGLLALALLAASCGSAVDPGQMGNEAGSPGESTQTSTAEPSSPASPSSTASPPSTVGVMPTVTTIVTFEGEPPIVVSRPEGCPAEPGSPIDLAAEPASWLAFGSYLRWTDTAGCPVRIDVISHIHGAEHCEWESASYISVGRPFGASINRGPFSEETVNRYIWDPHQVLPGGPPARSLDLDDLPDSVYDTGYRRDGAALWLDPADEATVYVVSGSSAEVWVRNPTLGLCA